MEKAKIIETYREDKGSYVTTMVKYECIDCGDIHTTPKSSYKVAGKYCKKCSYSHKKNTKHGLCRHPLYHTWQNIKGRVKGRDARSIKHYAHVSICEEWGNNFKSFYDWSLLNGWEEGLSIDRIRSDGDYVPSNCRWVTLSQNTINMLNENKTRSNNTSGYRGVWRLPGGKWQAEIVLNGKKKLLGRHKSAKDGAIAYDNFVTRNDLDNPRNFVSTSYLESEMIPPSVNHLYKTYCRNKRVVRVLTEEGKLFKSALGILAKKNRFKLIETDCVLEYNLFTNKKGRTDLDNTLKAILDGLEGIAYTNDSQIVEIHAKKFKDYGRDGFNITIRSL